ncbi:uncharacterized protein STEHIDRAFT_151145 [Stereum hirsutum FP-91666 SS1]|uniref:uncharacterized protein n=1 Tax=Stereum hirsutum (strain FP-91666) TaxID=721885 RepID=UPI000440F6FC|nr:uncharacterized protein STEHIDRAFT_151145 [Stereum hirsutum FP-91666 SS1]EIM91785.1 hypothetical protein STEHIDRAFT_151145 [Stereum hirsutum FP-91666 SS1]
MYFSFSYITSLTVLAASVLPSVFAAVGIHCGTTSDATLSDCQALVDPDTWNSVWAGTSNVCHYSNPNSGIVGGKAQNVACHGNCCVYVADGGAKNFQFVSETIRNEAAGLLGCGDTSKDKINGLDFFEDGHGTCISNGNGCGDCFDDSDFSGGCQIC